MNATATDAVSELREVIGVARATALFYLTRSSYYYRPIPEEQRRARGGGLQPRALGGDERAEIYLQKCEVGVEGVVP